MFVSVTIMIFIMYWTC